tara:strand:- start:222 stop:401 length:180 start_codon:yes stop_codon:yes gene_type:complete
MNPMINLFDHDHLKSLGMYIIKDVVWYSPWYYKSLQWGNYMLPNGDYQQFELEQQEGKV